MEPKDPQMARTPKPVVYNEIMKDGGKGFSDIQKQQMGDIEYDRRRKGGKAKTSEERGHINSEAHTALATISGMSTDEAQRLADAGTPIEVSGDVMAATRHFAKRVKSGSKKK
ncbi:hypothetical protein UFOVP115_111 [uncultured Caudovirales phage]|uniref:Uncharacterized protein n=1 Tax=uncultured Caudovirales phage TaxID=2100421 RepID=A0A6J5LDI0_9CAUD|nr:hypothetical protein UFOVP115_111 [uncultured Caudovirales phage]